MSRSVAAERRKDAAIPGQANVKAGQVSVESESNDETGGEGRNGREGILADRRSAGMEGHARLRHTLRKKSIFLCAKIVFVNG